MENAATMLKNQTKDAKEVGKNMSKIASHFR